MLSVTERRFHFRGKKYSKMCLKINWYLKTTLIFVFHGRRKHRWSRTSTTERWIQPFALPKCFYLFCLKEGKSFLGFFSLSFEGAFIWQWYKFILITGQKTTLVRAECTKPIFDFYVLYLQFYVIGNFVFQLMLNLLYVCFLDIDDCISSPCQHGANCIDKINDYFCDCCPGWSGKNCDKCKFSATAHLNSAVL